MFTYWLLLAFLLFCLGDVFSFYEMQKAFRCCSGLFLLFEIVCLCKKCKKKYLLCGLCCFLVLAGGFLAGTGKLETQKRWQTLIGKKITLQGAVEPDSIHKKEQGISALFTAEYPLRGKVRIFVKTDSKNAGLTTRKLLSGKAGMTGILKDPVFLRNPGTYDGYLFNKIRGVHGNLTVSPVQLWELGEPLPLRRKSKVLGGRFVRS